MALYAVSLELDNAGVLKTLEYACSSYMIDNMIRPHITLGVFKCERESVIMDYFDGLSGFLVPLTLSFTDVGMLDTGTVYLSPEYSDKLKSNYYKTYATLSKHFDAGFGGMFLPSKWMPHLSLGTSFCMSEAEELYEYIKKTFVPFKCKSLCAVLARCDPYKVIARARLRFDG